MLIYSMSVSVDGFIADREGGSRGRALCGHLVLIRRWHEIRWLSGPFTEYPDFSSIGGDCAVRLAPPVDLAHDVQVRRLVARSVFHLSRVSSTVRQGPVAPLTSTCRVSARKIVALSGSALQGAAALLLPPEAVG